MNERWKNELHKLNEACESLKKYVYETSKSYHQKGKLIGLVGGEHSVPLGYLEAIAEKYADFGILQIDAHMDLRKAYEGFTYSHASICYNASKIKSISKIIQVGIRDYCQEEMDFVKNSNHRIEVFYDYEISNLLFNGTTFHEICKTIVQKLPENVYISFDIDGLDPSLCPNTGTPVPGGLNFNQALYLIKHVVDSGKKIIGFDLCEVNGNNEWDGNVGARLLYRLSNLMGKSNKKI
jgi:agmatinase